jgi:hypothetical protein
MDYYTVRLTSGYQRFGGTWFLTASGYRLKWLLACDCHCFGRTYCLATQGEIHFWCTLLSLRRNLLLPWRRIHPKHKHQPTKVQAVASRKNIILSGSTHLRCGFNSHGACLLRAHCLRYTKNCPTYKGMVRSDMSKPALIFFTARVHTTKYTIKILAANTHCKYFLKIAEVTHFFCTRNRLYQRFVQPS